ncbi:MAG TPA: hypothetical protein VIL48_08140 [Acidimicrobiales bacterium]
MPKGIMLVESWPSAPEKADDFQAWYAETHIPDVLKVEGFLSARLFRPTEDGPFVAVYEVERDDLSTAVTALGEAFARGEMVMSDLLQMDPPPNIRILETVAQVEKK